MKMELPYATGPNKNGNGQMTQHATDDHRRAHTRRLHELAPCRVCPSITTHKSHRAHNTEHPDFMSHVFTALCGNIRFIFDQDGVGSPQRPTVAGGRP
jgi:hypothetical protein